MFQALDEALALLLSDAAGPPALATAEVNFLTPERTLAPQLADTAVNLFLYEVRENRELRDPVPIVEPNKGLSVRRLPPLRVDCAYLVTTWSRDTGRPGLRIASEHQLLAAAFAWLSRFPVIPQSFLAAANLTGQIYSPPTLVAQMDAAKNVGEFWSALGVPPRPFFNLIVTIAMDLDRTLTEFPVTTVLATYRAVGSTASEVRVAIGGTVRDRGLVPVPDAWVRLEPSGFTSVTDADGRFIFHNIAGGAGMRLRARARGFDIDAELANFEIPSLSGTYDLQF